MKKSMCSIAVISVSLGILPAATPLRADDPHDPLKAYVNKKDGAYAWTKRQDGKIGPTEYVELTLTSQKWQNMTWRHQLFILKPSTIEPRLNHTLLFITGGDWDDKLAQPINHPQKPPREAMILAMLAEVLKTPVAILRHVPRQPIYDGLYEDEIISLTFEQFLKTQDPEKVLLLPMVKSAVRAMDAVDEAVRQQWDLSAKTFTVTGASKRGWTTWLTAAVDPRVTAIAPMVFDMLNMVPQLRHQVDFWGDYSYKIHDYSDRGLPDHLNSPQGKALRDIVDPYSYRKRLMLPKLILLGTNDHYWPVDALNQYWDGLEGSKYILNLPNNRHGLKDYKRMIGTINALHQHVATGAPLPRLTWKFHTDKDQETLTVTSDVKPKTVQLWTAISKKCDFRDSQWKSSKIESVDGQYIARVQYPKSGYKAFFGETVYENNNVPYYLSTQVKVLKPMSD
ncbi:MAG: PhoPQ-activated pathogenicity protein [Pirellulales bacterium]|nr:PhoPQ-activated pathogenicity protein [Pirellulales bacterium]